jgi:hypothetical protein
MCALNSSRPRAEYPVAQKDLYTIIQLGWTSYTEHLPAFQALKTSYTAATATDQLAALEAARLLPDEDTRTDVHRTLRITLAARAEDCIRKWNILLSYIRDGFPSDQYESKKISAGHRYYRTATQLDWDSVSELMTQGYSFIISNNAPLTTGGMPPTFPAEFEALREGFRQNHLQFTNALDNDSQAVDAKITANNELYRALTRMLEDGRRIFTDNAAIREQFVLQNLIDIVDGPGQQPQPPQPEPTVARITGQVTSMNDGTPIGGAEVRGYTVADGPSGPSIGTTTDANGKLHPILIPELTERRWRWSSRPVQWASSRSSATCSSAQVRALMVRISR